MQAAAARRRAAPNPSRLSEPTSRKAVPSRSAARQASPATKRALKAMLVHAPVERGASEAELLGGERDIVGVLLQGLLHHLLLGPLEVQVRTGRRGGQGGGRAGGGHP